MAKRGVIAVLALLALAPATAAAAPVGPTATLSSRQAGAHDVALTVRFRSLLECGRLQVASIQLRLPRAMHVPARVARRNVLVSGRHPVAVGVTGSAITLHLAVPRVTCLSMGFGTVTIRIAPAAGLRNPLRKGAYDFTLVVGNRVLLGSLTIL